MVSCHITMSIATVLLEVARDIRECHTHFNISSSNMCTCCMYMRTRIRMTQFPYCSWHWTLITGTPSITSLCGAVSWPGLWSCPSPALQHSTTQLLASLVLTSWACSTRCLRQRRSGSTGHWQLSLHWVQRLYSVLCALTSGPHRWTTYV